MTMLTLSEGDLTINEDCLNASGEPLRIIVGCSIVDGVWIEQHQISMKPSLDHTPLGQTKGGSGQRVMRRTASGKVITP